MNYKWYKVLHKIKWYGLKLCSFLLWVFIGHLLIAPFIILGWLITGSFTLGVGVAYGLVGLASISLLPALYYYSTKFQYPIFIENIPSPLTKEQYFEHQLKKLLK